MLDSCEVRAASFAYSSVIEPRVASSTLTVGQIADDSSPGKGIFVSSEYSMGLTEASVGDVAMTCGIVHAAAAGAEGIGSVTGITGHSEYDANELKLVSGINLGATNSQARDLENSSFSILTSGTIDTVMAVASILDELASMRSVIVSGVFWVVSTTAAVVSTTSRRASVMFEKASSTTVSASAAL
jgi:hypothetical protein